jgi:hypothetical protein
MGKEGGACNLNPQTSESTACSRAKALSAGLRLGLGELGIGLHAGGKFSEKENCTIVPLLGITAMAFAA